TPGWRSCHGRSLSEMICDRGVVVVLIVWSPGSRDVVPESSAHGGGGQRGPGRVLGRATLP
ncbi:MAG TPA: hypothetical protein VGJ70_25705, partial [Solirubrobacteraceae bacterium]